MARTRRRNHRRAGERGAFMKTQVVTRCLPRRIASLLIAVCGATGSIAAWSQDNATAVADRLVNEGRQIFRFDTFGDEGYWGDTLGLHKAIEGGALGGVGPGVSPKLALAVGLKVDVDALPESLIQDLQAGRVNLDSPATTVALLKLNAVVGVTGFFNGPSLRSIGVTCALCHSSVDNAL